MMRITFTTISLLLVFSVFTVHIHGAMIANESDGAYCGGNSGKPCPPDSPKAITGSINEGFTGPTIRELIIEGGGYMLQSSMYINGFLNKIELSELSLTGPDFEGLQETINASIDYMEKAKSTYFQLKTLAGVTPYNQEVIYMLINFDYDSFQKGNTLFPYMFSKVRELLSVGDVTGVYNELYSYSGQILDLLYTIKRDVDAGIFPEISIVWKVNQNFSEVKLFGQYVACVFYSINHK